MRFQSLILLVSFFITGTNKSYIYHIDYYDRLTAFGDIHLGSFPDPRYKHANLTNEEIKRININQSKNIFNFIKKNNPNNSIVIIEDMYNYKDDASINNFFKNKRKELLQQNYSSCLGFTNNECINNNIPIVNIEFRQPYALFFSLAKIPASNFIEHVESLITEIKSFNDSPELNLFYKERLNDFLENSKLLDILKENKDKFVTYFNENQAYSKLEDKFLQSYHQLFDVILLHNIYKYQKLGKQIYLIAGDSHIERIIDQIDNLGFKHLFSTNSNEDKPLDINLVLSKFNRFNFEQPNLIFIVNFLLIIGILSIPALIREYLLYKYAKNRSY